MSVIPTNNTSGSSGPITITDWSTSPATLTLNSTTGVATNISADGKGGIIFAGSTNNARSFSKDILEVKIRQFQAGKYTRKYIDTYLDFMLMEAMLDNLQYLEYKSSLDKEQS